MSNTQKTKVSCCRNKLFSIHRDSSTFLKYSIDYFRSKSDTLNDNKNWPVVPNQRCGLWYALPHISPTTSSSSFPETTVTSTTHFKSTDGHINTWNFSLKRLNLEFLKEAQSLAYATCGSEEDHKSNAILLIDSSKNKRIPDSFSKTVPIWCTVLNRVAASLGIKEEWDTNLYTPSCCVSDDEHNCILNILDDRVNTVIKSGVILDTSWFLNIMRKPLRCFWLNNQNYYHKRDEYTQRLDELYDEISLANPKFTCILCISCSDPSSESSIQFDNPISSDQSFHYISGAGDDHELWSNGLTANLFWKYKTNILDKCKNDKETDSVIKKIVETNILSKLEEEEKNDNLNKSLSSLSLSYAQSIGDCGLYIGSRKSGKPPDCWHAFDAILNVTTMEYEDPIPYGKYYLQLPIQEGKRDKTELEKWLPLGIFFIGFHLASSPSLSSTNGRKGKKLLIHCAQGRDRSVAVAIGFLSLFLSADSSGEVADDDCSNSVRKSSFSFTFHKWFREMFTPENLRNFIANSSKYVDSNTRDKGCGNVEETHLLMYKKSGIDEFLASILRPRGNGINMGRELLFDFIRFLSLKSRTFWFVNRITPCTSQPQGSTVFPEFYGTKESLRLVLLIVQKYRPVACPSRSTMQKLNRFFMSGKYTNDNI